MTDPHRIFKRLCSDNEAERRVAANKLYESLKNGGGHPDDWELYKKGTAPKHESGSLDALKAGLEANVAEVCRQHEEAKRMQAAAAAAKERKAREKADAENAKLREQLKRTKEHAKAAPDADERVGLLSGLMAEGTLNKLTAEQIGERMQNLFGDRERRQQNVTAQVDLVIGQLTAALYQRYEDLYGKWRPRSNAPSPAVFLETHADKSASWCRRCFKAYSIVTADGWDENSWDCTGGIEGIIKSAADPNRPKVKRVSEAQKRLDALTDAVRKREWMNAEEMVNDWDNALA